MIEIGRIYTSLLPYYDVNSQKSKFKQRPILIIGGPQNNDYTVLPISTITKVENIDDKYDIKIDPYEYPKLSLNRVSYVRTHKQTTVHQSSLYKTLGSFKIDYEDTYLYILEMLEDFNNKIMGNAIY